MRYLTDRELYHLAVPVASTSAELIRIRQLQDEKELAFNQHYFVHGQTGHAHHIQSGRDCGSRWIERVDYNEARLNAVHGFPSQYVLTSPASEFRKPLVVRIRRHVSSRGIMFLHETASR